MKAKPDTFYKNEMNDNYSFHGFHNTRTFIAW